MCKMEPNTIFLGFANPTKSRQGILSLRAGTAFVVFFGDERFCQLCAAQVSAAALLLLLLEREHKGSCLVDMAKNFSEASDVKSTFSISSLCLSCFSFMFLSLLFSF